MLGSGRPKKGRASEFDIDRRDRKARVDIRISEEDKRKLEAICEKLCVSKTDYFVTKIRQDERYLRE